MPLKLSCIIAAIFLLIPSLGSPQALVQTGRYTAVFAEPTDAQRDPLSEIITVEFPDDIETVGEAVNALLVDTGYLLEDVLFWDVDVFPLVEHTIPRIQRELGPLTVLDAIRTLVGPAFHVVVDPVHRELAFELIQNTTAEEVAAPLEQVPDGERRRDRR